MDSHDRVAELVFRNVISMLLNKEQYEAARLVSVMQEDFNRLMKERDND